MINHTTLKSSIVGLLLFSSPLNFDRTVPINNINDSPIIGEIDLNPNGLGENGSFIFRPLGATSQNVISAMTAAGSQFVQEINIQYEHEHKIYRIKDFENSPRAKYIFVDKQTDMVIGYSLIDNPFFINVNHPASPIKNILQLATDQFTSITNLPSDLSFQSFTRLNEDFRERYAILKLSGNYINYARPQPIADVRYIIMDAFYPQVYDDLVKSYFQQDIEYMIAYIRSKESN